MYIFKNAFTSIMRNKGRNILIGIIIGIIACFCTITLTIRSSALQLIESYSNKYDITATLTMNRENMWENFNPQSLENIKERFENISNITISDIEKYGTSNYVKDYYYTMTTSMNADIEKATTNDSRPNIDLMPNDQGDFSVIGYSSLEAMEEFIAGKYSIQEGTISSNLDANECVINIELATLNNLTVGDTIILMNPNDESLTYVLTITGIFDEKEDDNNFSMFTSSANSIITNTKVINEIVQEDTTLPLQTNPTFILISKDVISNFETEVQSKGLDSFYQVSTNLDTINGKTEAIANVASFATTFLILTVIVGTIILVVIHMINIRERKYEIGVLRIMGMKKKTVTLQFGCELLIITVISLLLGLGSGSLLSNQTASILLKNEIENSQQQENDIRNHFGGQGFQGTMKLPGSNIEQVNEMTATIDITIMLKLIGIGLGLTIISTLLSMIAIANVEPLKILKERT